MNKDTLISIPDYTHSFLTLAGNQERLQGIRISTLVYTHKSYTHSHSKNDLALLLAHPNGLTKEMFVPYTKKLLQAFKMNNFPIIKKIVLVDMRNQGDSAIFNSSFNLDKVQFLWGEYGLDNWEIIKALSLNEFTLFGVGCSIGAVSLYTIEVNHPNTFKAIIAFEPTIFRDLPNDQMTEIFGKSKRRRGTWESKDVAREFLLKKTFFQAWDKEVFEIFMEYGLYTNEKEEIALKCSPMQEYKTFIDDPEFHPYFFKRLRELKSPVLFVHGKNGSSYVLEEVPEYMSKEIPDFRAVAIEDAGHLIPFEALESSVDVSINFLKPYIKSMSTNFKNKL